MPVCIVNSEPYMAYDWPHMLLRTHTGKKEFSAWAQQMLNWQTICFLLGQWSTGPSPKLKFFEALCRTMAFNSLPRRNASPGSEYMAGFQMLRRYYEKASKQMIPALDDSFTAHVSDSSENVVYETPFLSPFDKYSAGRSFCVTSVGSMAWVPRDTRLGDSICFLAGCSIPFVVRPVGSRFRLLGDCYLHGMMSDESITITSAPRTFVFI